MFTPFTIFTLYSLFTLFTRSQATSALDLANERVMYRALDAVPGLTIVSVGHRPSLLQFHAKLLRLNGADASPCFELGAVGEMTAAEVCELESG